MTVCLPTVGQAKPSLGCSGPAQFITARGEVVQWPFWRAAFQHTGRFCWGYSCLTLFCLLHLRRPGQGPAGSSVVQVLRYPRGSRHHCLPCKEAVSPLSVTPKATAIPTIPSTPGSPGAPLPPPCPTPTHSSVQAPPTCSRVSQSLPTQPSGAALLHPPLLLPDTAGAKGWSAAAPRGTGSGAWTSTATEALLLFLPLR